MDRPDVSLRFCCLSGGLLVCFRFLSFPMKTDDEFSIFVSGGSRGRRRFPGWGAPALAVLLLAGIIAELVLIFGRPSEKTEGRAPARSPRPAAETSSSAPVPAPPVSSLASLAFPTPSLLFDAPVPERFVLTNPEKPETALFGSARTGTDGRSRFHKGIDIAPVLKKDRNSNPTDPVRAIADGKVLYVNRVGGNSSYGAYVVLLHEDPVGPVYSLYAHLASVSNTVRKGVSVARGTYLGTMGYTSTLRIPKWNAHLHFETGLLLNGRFSEWERKNGANPVRGNGHGWNLLPLDSLEVLRSAKARPGTFSVAEFLSGVPVAYELVFAPARVPEFFSRHPGLWKGPRPAASRTPIVVACSVAGVPLSGRLATETEAAAVPTSGSAPRVAVQNVSEAALGRNGMRTVVKDRGGWRLGTSEAAKRYFELLNW